MADGSSRSLDNQSQLLACAISHTLTLRSQMLQDSFLGYQQHRMPVGIAHDHPFGKAQRIIRQRHHAR